jgi:hypothetical protein
MLNAPSKRHTGLSNAGRETFEVFNKLEQELTGSEWRTLESKEAIPRTEQDKVHIKEWQDWMTTQGFLDCTIPEKQEHRAHVQELRLRLEATEKKIKEMEDVGNKVLDFCGKNFESAALACLEQFKNETPPPPQPNVEPPPSMKCPLQRARRFKAYAFTHWGGNAKQVRGAIDDANEAIPCAFTKVELVQLVDAEGLGFNEQGRHFRLNQDAYTRGTLTAPSTDSDRVDFIRRRIPDEAEEIKQIQNFIDASEVLTLEQLRAEITKFCRKKVRTMNQPSENSLALKANHATQLESAYNTTDAALTDAHNTNQSLLQRIALLEQQQQQPPGQQQQQPPPLTSHFPPPHPQHYTANAAYGQTAMGMGGYAPTMPRQFQTQQYGGGAPHAGAHPGVGYQQGYQHHMGQAPMGRQMLECSYWDGTECRYPGPGPCQRANSHIQGQDQRPYHQVAKEHAEQAAKKQRTGN